MQYQDPHVASQNHSETPSANQRGRKRHRGTQEATGAAFTEYTTSSISLPAFQPAALAMPQGFHPAPSMFHVPEALAARDAAIHSMGNLMSVLLPGHVTAVDARRTARLLRNLTNSVDDVADRLDDMGGGGG